MELITKILIAFAILQIILFFKIWVMTNNVKKIKDRISPNKLAVKRELLKGNIEEARKILLDNLIDDIEDAREKLQSKYHTIDEIRDAYRPKFEKLNCQIPEEIEKLEILSDIDKLI